MKILAIETSCDETAISKVIATGDINNPQFEVVANAISSQINIHRPFGGVVPTLAKLEHEKNLPIILEKVDSIGFKNNEADLIAVTVGPGLEPALWSGIEFAKKVGKELDKPIIGVNHMEGHLYSFLLPKKTVNPKSLPRPPAGEAGRQAGKIQMSKVFPAIVLLVSGGHTILLKMDSLTKWTKLGETVDDAVGEAFDKVARMLELPYPGGPEIEKLAKEGDENAIDFPRPMLNQKNYNFSFSGLKTSVLYYIRDNYPLIDKNPEGKTIMGKTYADIAASFQKASTEVLVKKTIRAVKDFDANSVILAGGVAANKYLRQKLKEETEKEGASFFCPEFEYNTDNASMIAAAAYISHIKNKNLPLEANGNLRI